MPLKTPQFWRSKNGLAHFLYPLSLLYLFAHKVKEAVAKPYRSDIPVICVGGVVAGGSGKTPVVHALIKIIRENAITQNPVILTRGYGGKLKGPTLVDLKIHTADDVGDEALLHALHAPTIVSANRASGAKLAQAMDADLIIMDDGLQNSAIHKDVSFLVIDTRQGLGNGYLLPAGPLREPLKDALKKCTAVIQTNGKGDLHLPKTTLTTSLRVTSHHDKTQNYVAFAGLGNPDKFKMTLQENQFHLAVFKPFADHHPFTAHDIEKLNRDAGGLPIITTQKDYVRIPPSLRNGIEVLEIEQTFDYPAGIISLIKQGIGSR